MLDRLSTEIESVENFTLYDITLLSLLVKIMTASAGAKSDGREEIERSCVCIGGFLQPLPFVQKHYYTIYESNDGFADRILLCTPKPKLLKED